VQGLDSWSDDETELESEARLIEVNGASLFRESPGLWVFGCEMQPDLDAVPTAVIQIGDRMTRISLPINPKAGSAVFNPDNSCVVKVEETRTGAHVHAWISPERTVANALQNALASGYVLRAAEVADEAVELLRDKYSDPIGAALGGLILHKVGRLEKRIRWVENLARDFDWLPDGKVMLAHLLQNDESALDRALELAIQASAQRMLYAESYSLLLDLLRRWKRESDREVRKQPTDELASVAPYIDWESICLSQVIEEE
jgi:hypothetical protein